VRYQPSLAVLCEQSHPLTPFHLTDTGVEMAVACIGSGCAKVVVTVFKVDPRTRALYIQAGLSAALSTFLPSPLLGILLVQELSIATRPGSITLSSAVVRQHSSTMVLGEEKEVSIQTLADHDLMEQVHIASIATASCTAVLRLLFPDSVIESMRIQSYALSPSSSGYSINLDWLLAIPMGLLCGAVVTLAGMMYLKWNWTRVKGCTFLIHNQRFKLFVRGRQVFALLAGLICGVLGFLWSFPPLFDNGVNAWQNVLVVSSERMSPYEVLHFGFHVLIGVAICTGCGILGGCSFPMLTVGACVGAIFSPLP
jgi:H+/Cl- antiporter ClcA